MAHFGDRRGDVLAAGDVETLAQYPVEGSGNMEIYLE